MELVDGKKTDKSLMAWSAVFNSISAVGGNHDIIFDDPAIHATIEEMGGWVGLSCAGQK